MFWPFKKKEVLDHLSEIKKIKIHGMIFKIKRINVLDHCTGAKVCAAVYETYKVGNAVQEDSSANKVKSHFVDILMAGIVEPELSRKKEDGKLFVENLLTDWELASELHTAIYEFTYGKKNFKRLILQVQNS